MNLELNKIKKISKNKKVLIQMPAGLRTRFLEVARAVLSVNGEPIIWGGSCYGACDIPNYECDLLIHYGHEEFSKSNHY